MLNKLLQMHLKGKFRDRVIDNNITGDLTGHKIAERIKGDTSWSGVAGTALSKAKDIKLDIPAEKLHEIQKE